MEAVIEALRQARAHHFDVVEQAVAAHDFLHGQAGRAGHRMAEVRVTMLEEAGTVGEGIENLLAEQRRAGRLITAAKSLGDGHQVGRDAVLLAGVQRAGTAHAAHHLVQDQ